MRPPGANRPKLVLGSMRTNIVIVLALSATTVAGASDETGPPVFLSTSSAFRCLAHSVTLFCSKHRSPTVEAMSPHRTSRGGSKYRSTKRMLLPTLLRHTRTRVTRCQTKRLAIKMFVLPTELFPSRATAHSLYRWSFKLPIRDGRRSGSDRLLPVCRQSEKERLTYGHF